MNQSLDNDYNHTNQLAEIKNNKKEPYLSASPFFQGSLQISSLKMNSPLSSPNFPLT